MMVPARPRRWREIQRRPVQGNSPNDRILHGPDCYRPKRVCADAFPATPSPQSPRIEGIPRMRFSGMTESIGPMCSQNQNQNQNHANLRAGYRLPLVGPRARVKGRDGRTAPYPSSTMSSGRLFLDRVARQHCPSPLHRHGQNNMHPLPAPAEQDISTLQRIGHFYFALTPRLRTDRTDTDRHRGSDTGRSDPLRRVRSPQFETRPRRGASSKRKSGWTVRINELRNGEPVGKPSLWGATVEFEMLIGWLPTEYIENRELSLGGLFPRPCFTEVGLESVA
jgi:hypothetical protein